ncbi:PLDc N-terminal domain-containing protein [Actinomyces sp. zg-332]|uniref:PLDc N-terminal domain-containing protein n=1 Tax=Actinomyces sp. zg-332 TaxID=2708340 RepID=UPI001420F0E8|nr:PLDc N-terminal domain-containing protein [Actinomyces sp. zg-332]QPK94036.1 PLDc N-terminal domain-containing protein [Actinomyces sp. zg-332]
MLRLIPIVLLLVLTVYALVSCINTSSDEELPGGLPKIVWVVVIILVQPVGAISWLSLRFIKYFETKQNRNSKKDKVVAPDDDEEFLFKLNRDIQLEREGIQRNDSLGENLRFKSENTQKKNDPKDSDFTEDEKFEDE